MPSNQDPQSQSAPNNESPDLSEGHGSGEIPGEVDIWLLQYLRHYELAFLNEADKFSSASQPVPNYVKAAIQSIFTALTDSGVTPDQIQQLMIEVIGKQAGLDVENKAPWTSAKNSRRIELIDKRIQRTLSASEAVELELLTQQLRANYDTEEMLPLEGARQLHQQLLEKASKNEAGH